MSAAIFVGEAFAIDPERASSTQARSRPPSFPVNPHKSYPQDNSSRPG